MDNGPNSSAESGPKPRAAEPLYRLELSPGELLAILEHAKAALSAEEFAALQGAIQTLRGLTGELVKVE